MEKKNEQKYYEYIATVERERKRVSPKRGTSIRKSENKFCPGVHCQTPNSISIPGRNPGNMFIGAKNFHPALSVIVIKFK